LLSLSPALGCGSSLPEHARPKALRADPAQMDAADTIRYRALTRADFLGATMPPQFGDDPNSLAAATCVYIRSAPGSELVIRQLEGGRFEARARNLGFVALMGRGCSWWNDRRAAVAPEYVLQHEQIHFAILEVEARRMNARVPEITESTATAADAEREALALCQANLEELMQDHIDEAMERSTQFDEETSVGVNLERQQAWHEQLQAELRETER
jgi:hypothetical protein